MTVAVWLLPAMMALVEGFSNAAKAPSNIERDGVLAAEPRHLLGEMTDALRADTLRLVAIAIKYTTQGAPRFPGLTAALCP